MIISDLNYLEVVAQSEKVEGGILNIASFQQNYSSVGQNAYAAAGNGGLINALNVAAAVNVAAPIQANA
jgi:hypothetical protein